MDLKELVGELLSELSQVSRSDAVTGTVRDAGKAKVLPLSRISIGFGTAIAEATGKARREDGQGQGHQGADATGGGVGGAVVVEPRAFVVVGEDGVAHLLALQRGKPAVMRPGVEILKAPAQNPALGPNNTVSTPSAADSARQLGSGTSGPGPQGEGT